MASDGRQPRDAADDSPAGASAADLDQVQALVAALLDGRLTDDGRATLERLVVLHRAAARQYLRSVHLDCVLRLHVGVASLGSAADGLGDAPGGDVVAGADPLHETMVLPAIRDAAAASDGPPPMVPPPLPIRPPGPRPGRGRWGRGPWAAAAVVVGGAALTWAVRPRRPAAVVTATAAAVAVDGSTPAPGTRLIAGRPFRLAAGAVELTFDSGVVVVARGPAVFRVLDGNGLALSAGSTTAHVPSAAIGFRVEVPGMTVVDRGTDFGVRVTDGAPTDAATADGATADGAVTAGPPADDGVAAEVDVLAGRIDATVIGTNGRPRAAAVRVDAGHAVRHSPGSAAAVPAAVPFAPAGFELNIARVRVDVPCHGTGAGIAPGTVDPNWQVTSTPGRSSSGPAPAFVVVDPLADYAKNGVDKNGVDGQWISTAARAVDAAAGRFVFHTTVDLTGFDPATVQAAAWAAADDQVNAVLVNGVRAAAGTGVAAHGPWWAERHRLPINGRWHAGVNDVDVLVDNFPGRQMADRAPNFMALQFSLSLSAVPLVRR